MSLISHRLVRHLFPVALIVLIFLQQPLWAHRPVFTEDHATSPATAISMTEPDVSQVVYREMTEGSPQIWLSFDVPEDFDLYFQVGVPVIEGLEEFRPAMVVVGPGLPQEDAPFDLPEGLGFKIFPTAEVEEPREFHEHFTGTDSWILRTETLALPGEGKYYLVAFSPEEQVGKLWLSIGKKEVFRMEDWREFPNWRKRIREFHEVED
jgi:hypothetical protein